MLNKIKELLDQKKYKSYLFFYGNIFDFTYLVY